MAKIVDLNSRNLSVEVVRQHAREKEVVIGVSSKMEPDERRNKEGRGGRNFVRGVVQTVTIRKESELTPNLILSGPKRLGEVNVYVGINGHKLYFSAESGEALAMGLKHPEARRILRQMPA